MHSCSTVVNTRTNAVTGRHHLLLSVPPRMLTSALTSRRLRTAPESVLLPGRVPAMISQQHLPGPRLLLLVPLLLWLWLLLRESLPPCQGQRVAACG